ncbi:hypothetical protein LXA43DRAFT_1028109 [Ganoderma leucocontextum]|nr:hypothetical protein LXA43DRAFT_1028109 [Ganoderma leucocontextum]
MSLPSESTQLPEGSQPYTRDSEFFDLEPLYLRAESTIFCVPRHYFETSDVFVGMFTLPEVPNSPREGSSAECPLFLEGIKAGELKDFLRVLSFRFAGTSDDSETTIKSLPTSWLSVLRLATLWLFPLLRERSLKFLMSEDCMTRLIISRQPEYGVKDWFLSALEDVIIRRNPLTADEINQLGLDLAVKVIAAREMAREDGHGRVHFSSRYVADEDITGKATSIRLAFRLPSEGRSLIFRLP